MRGRRMVKMEKLNLIPILDAIFIFIFFLLMSAQFVQIYELGGEVPVVSTVKNEDKKDPLNLVVEVTKSSVVIKTGLNGKTVKTISLSANKISNQELKEIESIATQLKEQFAKENVAIIRPSKDVTYQVLVKVMDAVKGLLIPVTDDTKRDPASEGTLFSQIVFESL